MGNYMTKLLPPHFNETEKENSQVQATERQADVKDDTICTPILSDRPTITDPRSVSMGIVRTPIEIRYSGSDDQSTPVLATHKVASAIPRYLQAKQYLETDMDSVMPPFTPKKHCIPKLSDSGQSLESDGTQDCVTPHIDKKCSKAFTPIDKERYSILGIDPRSPAADFNRTPILIPKSLAKLKARSQEHLTRRGSYDTDIYDPKISWQGIRTINSPENRLLTDIATKYSKILSLEKSEEPNVSNTVQSDSDATTISEGEAEVTVIKNLQFNNTEETVVSNDQKIGIDKQENNVDDQDSEDIEHDIATMYVSKDVSSLCKQSNDQKDYSDKIKVWQDPLSSEENVSSRKEKENVVKLPQQTSPREDVIITFDEDVTLSKSGKVEELQKKEEMGGKKKMDSKINTKLDSNEEKLFSPSNKYGTETLKNRMPFSNRSNKDQMPRITTKSPQQLFKNKTLSSKEQENTPPCQKYGGKTRSDIQWDSNSTIFI